MTPMQVLVWGQQVLVQGQQFEGSWLLGLLQTHLHPLLQWELQGDLLYLGFALGFCSSGVSLGCWRCFVSLLVRPHFSANMEQSCHSKDGTMLLSCCCLWGGGNLFPAEPSSSQPASAACFLSHPMQIS